jgi:hypothetical protein
VDHLEGVDALVGMKTYLSQNLWLLMFVRNGDLELNSLFVKIPQVNMQDGHVYAFVLKPEKAHEVLFEYNALKKNARQTWRLFCFAQTSC